MSDLDTLYARWLDGELSTEEIKSLKESGEWSQLEALVLATNNMALPIYNKEQAFEQLMSTKKVEPAPDPQTAKRISMSTILSAAASLLLLLTAYFYLKDTAPNLRAPNGENEHYVFVDKSTVTLNDGSAIAFKEKTWDQHRTVKLTGEAVFEVAQGPKFVVETKNGNIEVIGTGFNVRAWDDNLAVECYHGKVKVKSAGGEVLLTKLEATYFTNGSMSPATPITHDTPNWKNGFSKFQNESLNNVFAELARQFNISIDRPNLEKKFTGIFNHEELELALQQVTKPMGLRYNTNKENKRVIITN